MRHSTAADSGTVQDDTPLPQLPQKRTHEAMLACVHDLLEPPHYAWDGSPETQYYNQHRCTQFAAPATTEILQQEGCAVLYTDLTGQGESEADSSDPDQPIDPASRLNARKEAKALEREIPWRQIMRLPPEQIQAHLGLSRSQ